MLSTLLLTAHLSIQAAGPALYERPTATEARAPAIERFVLTGSSEVGYDGTSTLHDWTGRSRSLHGELCTSSADPTVVSGAWIEVDARTLKSGNSMRDSGMRDRLEVEAHPRIRFELDVVTRPEEGSSADYDVRGRFEIRGISRARTVRLQVAREDAGLHVTGRTRFPMSEHGITPPDMLLVSVDDEVEVWFDLHFKPRPDTRLVGRAWDCEVHETDQSVDGERTESRHRDRLWETGRGLLLESTERGSWVVASDDRVRTVVPARHRIEPAPRPIEVAFAESEGRVRELRRRVASLPEGQRERVGASLERTIERIERGLALAPAGELEVEREGDRFVARFGGEVWADLEGLRDGPDLGPLLAQLDGLPSALREHLLELRGLPTKVHLRTATPAGVRELEFVVGSETPGAVPAQDYAPERWCEPAEVQR